MLQLDGYEKFDGIRLNMVATTDGSFVDSSGSSRGISNSEDRDLLIHLRGLSDLLITGGKTARTERYFKPKALDLAIITRKQGDAPEGAITYTPESEQNATQEIVNHFYHLGYKRILLETGPSLSKEFLRTNLVDEFCLTVPNGKLGDCEKILQTLGAKMHLASSFESNGTLFTRWRRGYEASA